MDCLDEIAILALVDGRVSPEDRVQIDVHLDGCAVCLDLLAHATRATTAAPLTRESNLGAAISTIERYEIGAELARGGMGQVVTARDRRLDRPVALKFALDAASAQRFAREVSMTSRLEHPGIVPVHDAGVLDDGTPFYAMRLVAGETLDARIAAAHGLADRLALVPHLLAVADAMAYVHSRGIIHRDLKPQNIVLGEFGETVVVDWGLAKPLEAAGAPAAAPTAGANPDNGATLHGEVVGTPGYMAPEQAAGAPVDLRTDVYGLGATLYHLLSGTQPHRSRDRAEPVRPLLVAAPGVPQELAAIVARAMAERPEDRYPSANELAGDLRRFQTGRLVEAHHYSVSQRLARWLGRHRGAVAVAAVAAVVVAGLSIAGVRRIVAERAEAQAARAVAESQRSAAEALVAFLLDNLHDRLDALGKLELLADTAAEVVAYYDRTGADATREGRAHRSDALTVTGEARLAAGDAQGALAALRDALSMAETLSSDAASDALRCGIELRIGEAERVAGRAAAATPAFEACNARAHARLAAAPGDARWRELAARSDAYLAPMARVAGDGDRARRLAREALDLASGVDAAADVRVRVLADLAVWEREDRNWPEAARAADETLSAARALRELRPDDASSDHAIAGAWERIGKVREHSGDLAGAAEAYRREYDTATALVAREPRNLGFRDLLGVAIESLGRLALRSGDGAAARRYFRESRDLSAELVEIAPDAIDYIDNLARSELTLGDLERELGNAEAAREPYARSIAGFERLVALAPKEVARKGDLGLALGHLAELQRDLKELAAARATIDRSVALAREVLAAAPSPASRLSVAERLYFLADIDRAVARESITEALELVVPVRPLAAGDEYLTAFLAALDEAADIVGAR